MTLILGAVLVINLAVLAAYRHSRDHLREACERAALVVAEPAGSHAKPYTPPQRVGVIERRPA